MGANRPHRRNDVLFDRHFAVEKRKPIPASHRLSPNCPENDCINRGGTFVRFHTRTGHDRDGKWIEKSSVKEYCDLGKKRDSKMQEGRDFMSEKLIGESANIKSKPKSDNMKRTTEIGMHDKKPRSGRAVPDKGLTRSSGQGSGRRDARSGSFKDVSDVNMNKENMPPPIHTQEVKSRQLRRDVLKGIKNEHKDTRTKNKVNVVEPERKMKERGNLEEKKATSRNHIDSIALGGQKRQSSRLQFSPQVLVRYFRGSQHAKSFERENVQGLHNSRKARKK